VLRVQSSHELVELPLVGVGFESFRQVLRVHSPHELVERPLVGVGFTSFRQVLRVHSPHELVERPLVGVGFTSFRQVLRVHSPHELVERPLVGVGFNSVMTFVRSLRKLPSHSRIKNITLPDEFLVLIARLDERSEATYQGKESSGLVKHALARHFNVLGFLVTEHG
jgi:hypothetical protein